LNIVVFTGAGLSVESNIPTFDDPKGIFSRYDKNLVATEGGYDRDWETFDKFWKELEEFLLDNENIMPNEGHIAISEWEKKNKGDFTVITTNVDNLHERAGSSKVLHIHGDITKKRYIDENRSFPDCVLFGEDKRYIDECNKIIIKSDLLVYVGSSITTKDEGFLYLAKNNDIKTIEINPMQTKFSDQFDLSIRRTAKDVLGILADFSLLLQN